MVDAPRIPVKVKVGPINRLMMVGIVAVVLVEQYWPERAGDEGFLSLVFAIVAATTLTTGVKRLIKDYVLRRNLAILEAPSTAHGSAAFATRNDIVVNGMNNPEGDLLGLDDTGRPVFRPEKTPFLLAEIPPGGGKTSNYVINSILNRAERGYSLVIADPKAELGAILAPSLQVRGYEVWRIRPGAKEPSSADVEVNCYQALIDAVYATDDERKNVVPHAMAIGAIHAPSAGTEGHPYFQKGSVRFGGWDAATQAVFHPDDCTPTAVYSLMTNQFEFIKRAKMVANMQMLDPDDKLAKFLRNEAVSIIAQYEDDPENFGAFLQGVTQNMISFNPSGPLGDYGIRATHNIADIRDRQIVVFIETPLSHMRDFGEFISFVNANVIAACKRKPSGYKVHIVAEEALAYRFNELAADLEVLREIKVTADFYIQSFAGLERVYGAQAARSIDAYCDVHIYTAQNAYDRAKHISDMVSDMTVREDSASFGHVVTDMNISSRHFGRPMMKPNEIMTLDRRKALVFVRGMPPMSLTMVNYGQVNPWRDWVGNSPISGTRLRGKPVLTIRYPGKK